MGLGTAALGFNEMHKSLGKDWWKTSFFHLPPFKELAGFAFSSNISSTIILLVRDSEALWIAYFLSPVEVGYAKTALAIINLVQIPITPFISTTYPEINQAVIQKDWTLLRRLLKRVTLISGSWTGIAAIGLTIFGRWLLQFYGADFQPAYIPMLTSWQGWDSRTYSSGTARFCFPWGFRWCLTATACTAASPGSCLPSCWYRN